MLGIEDAAHEESAAGAPRLVISKLTCSLVGVTGAVKITPGTLAHRVYETAEITEQFRCNYGLNPKYATRSVGGRWPSPAWTPRERSGSWNCRVIGSFWPRSSCRECRAGRVRSVILPSLDRLSRDVRIAENLFHEFETLGVDVRIADMPTYNSKDRKDVLVRQIREAIAEEARKEIIERLWKGRQERVRRGLFPGGNVPYGFRRNGKGLEVDHAEAAIVKRIFALAKLGRGAAAGARALNQERVIRRNGRPWTQRQVAAVLARNALYRDGLIRYGPVTAVAEGLALLKSAVQ